MTSHGSTLDNVNGSNPAFYSCHFEGVPATTLDLSGSGNLDGTSPEVSTLFIHPLNPASALSKGGDMRLLVGSSAVDAGNDNINTGLMDFAGNPRIQGAAIDIGALEGAYLLTFELIYPDLTRDGDENHNGVSNFLEYATGGDPAASNNPFLQARLQQGKFLILSYRANASDICRECWKSTDLQKWYPLVEDIDYSVVGLSQNGVRIEESLELKSSLLVEPRLFFRQGYGVPSNESE